MVSYMFLTVRLFHPVTEFFAHFLSKMYIFSFYTLFYPPLASPLIPHRFYNPL
jgi:hypothetical protein